MPVTQGESLDFERYYLGDFVDPHDVSGNGYVAALMGSPSRPLAGLFKIEVSGVTEFVNLHQFVPDVTQQSQANAVNDHGQVAGVFGDDEIPVLWNPLPDGTYAVTSLPVPADAEDGSEAFDCCEVYGINNSGWIVGASQVTESTSGQTQAAVVWRPTANGYVIERLPDVGTPPALRERVSSEQPRCGCR